MPHEPPADLYETVVVPAIIAAVRTQDHRQHLQWMQEALATMQRDGHQSLPRDPQPLRQMASSLARAIWNITPLPRNGYRPDPIATPGRNDSCACGSGRKYKHCCMEMERRVPLSLTEAQIWPIALAALTRKQTEEAIALKRVRLDAAIGGAVRLNDLGKTAQAIALLEPFLEHLSRTDQVADYAFDTLCSLYDDAGKPGKKKTLIEHVLAKAPRSALRTGAWSRLATIRCDQGDKPGAWEAFRAAQRDNADDPMLGALEVQLLVAENRMTEARDRARFWRARLERLDDDGLEGVIGWLRQFEQNPHATLARTALDSVGDREHVLLQWIASLRERPLPAYVVVSHRDAEGEPAADSIGEQLRAMGIPQAQIDKHRGELQRQLTALTERVDREGSGATPAEERDRENAPQIHALRTPRELSSTERKWAKVVPCSKPFSVQDEPMDGESCWEPGVMERWLDFLSAEANAADSISILDDVATALGMHPLAGQRSFDEELLRPVLERAAAILEAAVTAAGRDVQLPWLAAENRPALRSLARLHGEHASAAREAEALCAAQRLLELNPDDNHAMRAAVMRALLLSGRDEEAWALAQRHDDDVLVEMRYGAALALFRLGQLEKATLALRRCVDDRPKIPKYVVQEEIRQPKLSELGITMGGADEAWYYRQAIRSAWVKTPGALEWLTKVANQVRPGSVKASAAARDGV